MIDLLVYPEQAFVGMPSPKHHVVPGVPLLLDKGAEQLTFIHECRTGYEALALTIELCAKVSRLDPFFSLRRSIETKEYIIRTSHKDVMVVSYDEEEVFADFEVNSRMQSFKVLMFLFREVRRIQVINVCLLENVANRYFSLEIDESLCAMVHYDPQTEMYGSPDTLRREMELILNGRPPMTDDEQKAMNMGSRIREAYYKVVIPEQLSFLSDVDASEICPWGQVLVSRHSSCPQSLPKQTVPIVKSEKKTRKQQLRLISQQKAIEKKSYNSFWDRIEMRGDHDD